MGTGTGCWTLQRWWWWWWRRRLRAKSVDVFCCRYFEPIVEAFAIYHFLNSFPTSRPNMPSQLPTHITLPTPDSHSPPNSRRT